MSNNYTLDDLVSVAKRENNTKRSYLYVDPLQGKHIPVSPGASLELFGLMAEMLEEAFPAEKLLVVGFAETATAIGTAIACKAGNVAYYMNTTREDVPGGEYLYFTESHSHATEQRLVANGLEKVLDEVDRVVFAEDEVTTGNTIEKLIWALKERFPGKAERFGIISVLNSMPPQRIEELRERNVDCLYVLKLPEMYRASEIEKFSYKALRTDIPEEKCQGLVSLSIPGQWNSRVVCDVRQIRGQLQQFCEAFFDKVPSLENCGTVLMLGTEEFMFPAMMLGALAEKRFPGLSVRNHATTRSPIEISADEEYPLHGRWKLRSLYEDERITYVYNLKKYDRVFIVTDAPGSGERGLESLVAALKEAGNEDITLLRWVR